MLHELETLLFSDITRWEHRFDADEAIEALKRDVAGIEPEAINETPTGAPSRRIMSWLDEYQKVLHGPLAVVDIGLERIRAACPHFASWVDWLEQVAEQS
jgi:hypothetical protein